MATILFPFMMTFFGDIKGKNSHFSSLANSISSGTARMLVNPFLNTTNTRLAPHLKAEVQQSNAVSPAPRTITFPESFGSCDLQAHIPKKRENKRYCVQKVNLFARFTLEQGYMHFDTKIVIIFNISEICFSWLNL